MLQGMIYNRELINENRVVCENFTVTLVSIIGLHLFVKITKIGVWTGLYMTRSFQFIQCPFVY